MSTRLTSGTLWLKSSPLIVIARCASGAQFDRVDVVVPLPRSSIAKNWVRAVAANFTAFEFFFNRCGCCHLLHAATLAAAIAHRVPVWCVARCTIRATFQARLQVVLNNELREAHASVDSVQVCVGLRSVLPPCPHAQSTCCAVISSS